MKSSISPKLLRDHGYSLQAQNKSAEGAHGEALAPSRLQDTVPTRWPGKSEGNVS
jgi:hypothetical protein